MVVLEVGKGIVDWDGMGRAVERATAGSAEHAEAVRDTLVRICDRPSRWQWVIHGATQGYRAAVVRLLCAEGQFGKARRFACCGKGDMGYASEKGSEVCVKVRCCGYRCCPRCSRRYGRRALRKVTEHLSAASHGVLGHMVLTQEVLEGEGLLRNRERFERKWKTAYRAFQKAGATAMLVTNHVKRSRTGGWHYHAHVLVEWGEGCEEAGVAGVGTTWRKACRALGESDKPVFYRHVAEAGGALAGMAGDGQGEFWQESSNPVEKVIQYLVRDVCQGLERWIEGVEDPKDLEDFVNVLGHAKLHRCYGRWRAKCGGSSEGEAKEEGKSPKSATKKERADWMRLGTVDNVIRQAKAGIEVYVEFLAALRGKFFNRGDVCRRLMAVFRWTGR